MKHLAFIVNFTRTIDICLFENDQMAFKKTFRLDNERDEERIRELLEKYIPDEKLDTCFFFTGGSGASSYLKELEKEITDKREGVKIKWL